ncbi:MAG: phytoene desaturase [Candidatus Kapabacteria bacterium]|nr:phytoene desaturase [Ignavibacteriota bacterium]MCW5885145.1 phytoene desaturase [Candidatus Kapabacteria bacterium]
MKRIGIIGGGLGALSAAIYLGTTGRYKIDIFEKNESLGGKLGEIHNQGFRFDTGPSVVTMKSIINDVFHAAAEDPDEYLAYDILSPVNRNFFSDGTFVDTFSEIDKFRDEIAKISSESADNLNKYYNRISGIYKRTADVFLYSQIHEVLHLIKTGNIPNLFDFTKIDAFSTMHEVNSGYFKNEKILKIFDRYATYNGSSPHLAPGTLNLISYVELVLGAYYLKSGIITLPRAFEKILRKYDVQIHLNQEVDEILVESGTAKGLRVNGVVENYDYIISNADVVHTFSKLIRGYENIRSKLEKVEPSISGMVFLWGVKGVHDNFLHHNVVYSDDYKNEFDEIFTQKKAPSDPTTYIAITSKTDPEHAPVGCENWFVLVNMPYLNDNPIDTEEVKSRIFKKLKSINVDIESKIIFERVITPQDLYNRYLSNKGSIYGISSNSMFTAFKRQSNRSKVVKNLYFSGGSVHPGGGIPLVILSGKHSAEIIKRLDS